MLLQKEERDGRRREEHSRLFYFQEFSLMISELFGILSGVHEKAMRKILYHIVVASCFLGQPVFAQSAERIFTSKVSPEMLKRTVRELVQCGNRLGGTPSGDKAAHLLAAKFRQMGYAPTIVEGKELLVTSDIQWKLRIESPSSLRGLIQHEWLAGFSPSVPETILPLVAVSPDEIDESRVRGSAVLLSAVPTEEEYEALADAGAQCILAYTVVNSNAYQYGAMIASLKKADDNPIPLFTISRMAGERLTAELKKGTQVTIRFSSMTKITEGRPKTVLATLQGASDDYYIVCAHGDADSGGPGADDNASGVAGVLEVARILKLMMKQRVLSIPAKSIRFIVWGTEYESASHYVGANKNELTKIAGVINIDEIGIGRPRQCIYFEGNDVKQNEPLLKVLNSIGEEYAMKKGFWKEATTTPCQGGTDSYVFLPNYLRRLRVREEAIPTITVFTAAWNEPKVLPQTPGWTSKAWQGDPDSVLINYSPYYHSSLDIPRLTTEKEPEKMVWAVRAVGIALIRLLWNK